MEVLEGTWEEILLHAADLAGKRVSVTVIGSGPESGSQLIDPNSSKEDFYSKVLEDLFQEAENIGKMDTPPETGDRGHDPYEAAFGGIVTEKFRKQGFNI